MSREILIVAPYLPWPADFGGAIRIYEIVHHLTINNRVILLAPAAPNEMDAIQHLRDICDVTAVPVTWTFRQPAGVRKRLVQAQSIVSRRSLVELASWEPRVQSVLDRLFMTRHIELVQYEFPQMTLYRPLRPIPTVLNNHNIEHELVKRVAGATKSLPQQVFNAVEWRKLRRLERAAWSAVTLNVATSVRDAERVAEWTGQSVPVIPNGVDVAAYKGAPCRNRVEGRVVFVGAMRHQPNADGARWYAEQVHPLVVEAVPEATFQIVGADPPAAVSALNGGSISVTGRVESVVPYLSEATVAVVPLHAGGGTRLKILEAFATGVPVVSTTVGAEGLDAVGGQHLLIADTPRDFADAVVRVIRGADPAMEHLKASALALAQSNYDWGGAIVPKLVAAHDEAIKRFNSDQ